MGNFLRWVVNFVVSLAVIAVTYFIFSAIGFMGDCKYTEMTKLVLFLFVPLGFAFFSFPESPASTFEKILSLIGVLIMVASTLVLHITLMGDTSLVQPGPGYFVILPLVWIAINITYHNIGNEEHEGWEEFKNGILGYVWLLLSIVAISFILSLANAKELGIIWLVVGGISMLVLGISFLKNGSPFE